MSARGQAVRPQNESALFTESEEHCGYSDLLSNLLKDSDLSAVLIDMKSLHILWASTACVKLDPRLHAGNTLHALPEIAELVAKDAFTASTTQGTNSAPEQSSIAYATLRSNAHSSLNVGIRRAGEQNGRLMLLLEPEQQLDSYYRQYVAERDELFNTSRALTVNEMATTLAHELNQPIGTVINLLHGSLERLRSHNIENELSTIGQVDDDVLDALDFAIRQSSFASQIIARVREFTEARQPNIEQVDLRHIVNESVDLLDWVLSSEQIVLKVDTGTEALLAGCDKMLLQQVLVNVCRNAIEALRDVEHGDRRLFVLSYRSEDGVHVEVADTGPGMEEAKMADMFKPFVSAKRHGMGVGLNICRSFVELHQGKLWVTRNEYQGCTVHIRLPAI